MHITKAEVKLLRMLAQKKVRDREKRFIVEGWKPLSDALNSDFHIDLVAATPRYSENPDYRSLITTVEARGIVLKEMTDSELKKVTDTVHAQGVVAIVHQRTRTFDEILALRPRLVVLADHIADPGNLGTMIRTCDWFGADAFMTSEGCVDLYNEKVVRSTSGSIFHLPIIEHVDLKAAMTLLKSSGFRCFATSGDAESTYMGAAYGEKNAIILGNEATGVRSEIAELADEVISIPRVGKAESLNVGVACGILLAHLSHRN
jgi:TrmH family RNA methyltransferase